MLERPVRKALIIRHHRIDRHGFHWMVQSILAGAMGVTGKLGNPLSGGFAWDDRWLQFAVREPFPSQTTGTSLVFGEVTESKPLQLESFMPENGVVFSDGVEQDYLAFNSGCILTIGVAEHQGALVST